MTGYVARAIENRETLVVEAGTGVGKTFAYLVPAVLSGKKVIISTATRYLQKQIYSKDLPRVLEALGIAVDTVLLKGRANYLCLERLEQAFRGQSLIDRRDNRMVKRIYEWSKVDSGGDIGDFPDLGEDAPLWVSLTSTSENCLGSRCPKFDRCCVVAARNAAKQADIVIVNHYLLFSDMELKEEGVSQLLPDVETVIVDEAHHLGDIADQFFSISFSASQCMQFLADMRVTGEEAKNLELRNSCTGFEVATKKMAQALGGVESRDFIAKALEDSAVAAARSALADAMAKLEAVLAPLRDSLEQLSRLHARIREMRRNFAAVFETGSDYVGWYQRSGGSFRLYASPAEVSELLGGKAKLYKANWIYTSATLSVASDFSYFLSRTGLEEDCSCVALDSPFDYTEQVALYLPTGLPEPNDAGYTLSLLEASYPLLEMSQGGVFFLFTSHRALQVASRAMQKATDYTLLVQGDMSKAELIRRFCNTPDAVLLGTASFWGGVDVRGAGLRCVIIDRLPFASPADPLTQGRMRRAREQGHDFFRDFTLPEAVISLRQGIGRLVRDESDRGVVMIGDKRLRTKSYGRVFLDSLPPMKRFGDIESLRPYLGGTAAG